MVHYFPLLRCFTFISSFAPVWLLNCRLHIVQSNIVSTINIIDIYVTLFSSFHKLFYTMSCTCMLGCRKILVKDELNSNDKIGNDATYKIKS